MDTAARFSHEAPARHSARSRVWPVLVIAGAAWGLVGALPWIVDGLGASSPREWAADAVSGEASGGYITLLPFRAALLPYLFVVTLVGGAAAGLSVRWVRRDVGRRVLATVNAVLGAFAATAYAVAQSAGATRQLGNEFDSDDRTLLGLVVVAVTGSVVGLVLGLCVALGRPVLAAVATAPLAVALGAWAVRLAVVTAGGERAALLLPWSPLLVGLVLGLALARVGVRPGTRTVLWVVVLGIAVVVTALDSAFVQLTSELRPGMGLPSGLRPLLDDARGDVLLALRPTRQAWFGYAVAAGVGLVGTLAMWNRADDVRSGDASGSDASGGAGGSGASGTSGTSGAVDASGTSGTVGEREPVRAATGSGVR